MAVLVTIYFFVTKNSVQHPPERLGGGDRVLARRGLRLPPPDAGGGQLVRPPAGEPRARVRVRHLHPGAGQVPAPGLEGVQGAGGQGQVKKY